jgi:hypothetical protein
MILCVPAGRPRATGLPSGPPGPDGTRAGIALHEAHSTKEQDT